MTAQTLTLAGVARLARVERPVVTMWRKRPVPDHPFPSPQTDGTFLVDEIVAWLEQTQRGNNPHARTDAALESVLSHHSSADELRDLAALVAARAVLDRELADFDAESLLDAVDEIDPDDTWLFTELEGADIELLQADADALADASWSNGQAYDRLLDALTKRDATARALHPDLVNLIAGLAKALLGRDGALVDVDGTMTDALLAVLADENYAETAVVLPEANNRRDARRRLAVHHVPYNATDLADDWHLPPSSIALLNLPDSFDTAMDLLDETVLQLSGATCALVVGPAATLVDELPTAAISRRDQFLRNNHIAAVVRLPQGLLRSGSREHLALWLLQADAPAALRVGDLSGQALSPATAQLLLDDLLAAARSERRRAFSLLQAANIAHMLVHSTSLVSLDQARPIELPSSARDDAARIRELLDTLAAPLPDPFTAHTVELHSDAKPLLVTLGDAAHRRLVTVRSGTRMPPLPAGRLALWTADAVAAGQPDAVDLLALTAAHPGVHLTRPDDVVFTTAGNPRAIVDAHGGSAVAYPARILRVGEHASLSPRAIADVINRTPPGNSKWRSWQVPLVSGHRDAAEDMLRRVDVWDEQLTIRQTQVAELRRLLIRSALSGAVTLTDHAKGQ